jgi:hypothetical protein
MNIHDAFNIPVAPVKSRAFGPRPAAEDGANVDGRTQSVGAFITVQSLVSFTGATGVITALWSAIKALGIPSELNIAGHTLELNIYVGFILSLTIGMVIYYINVTDPKTQYDKRDKIIGLFIAIFNTVVLFNASRAIVG